MLVRRACIGAYSLCQASYRAMVTSREALRNPYWSRVLVGLLIGGGWEDGGWKIAPDVISAELRDSSENADRGGSRRVVSMLSLIASAILMDLLRSSSSMHGDFIGSPSSRSKSSSKPAE